MDFLTYTCVNRMRTLPYLRDWSTKYRDDGLVIGVHSPEFTFEGKRENVVRGPGDAHGTDVDNAGYGTVTEPRMYQLIRQPAPISDRTLEIEFLDENIAALSFTFG